MQENPCAESNGPYQGNPPASAAPYPTAGSEGSSFEVEPEEFDDIEFSEGPSQVDRIRRGISNYATVSKTQNEEGFQHVRSSSLLAEDRINGAVNNERRPPLQKDATERGTFLTNLDLSAIEQLDADYEQALVTREIGWNARYISVRQNAGLSAWFFFVFLFTGILVFSLNTKWTIEETLLFSMYTMTTVGYGKHEIPPDKPGLLIFICFYIFIGIAMLTILVAQLYQWIVLEVTWAQYERDSKKFIKKHREIQRNSEDLENVVEGGMMTIMTGREAEPKKNFGDKVFDVGIRLVNWVQAFVKDNPSGQLVVVLVPFSIMISIGAAVVGGIEGWNFSESIYFGVVSMTTVGYGDYYPSKISSTWFCVFWLPFSVGFLSLYLGSVAHLYIDLSTRNVTRIEKKLRRRVNKFKRVQDEERAAAIARGTSGGFGMEFDDARRDAQVPSSSPTQTPSHLNVSSRGRKRSKNVDFLSDVSISAVNSGESFDEAPPVIERRENILHNSHAGYHGDEKEATLETMKSMKNVLIAVKQENMATPRRSQREVLDGSSMNLSQAESHLSLKSTKHYTTAHGVEKKPPFALRVLLQERFSNIIAHEIAGYQSQVEIKNNTLSVTIDSLKHTADKWDVPRRARKSFRAVAFEVLYFVGERALIVRGADAVFDLTPKEVQGLFAPLLTAFGDADTMEAWLMRTQVMADNELNDVTSTESRRLKFEQVENNRADKVTQNMTANPNTKRNVIGNAITNQK